MQVQGGWVAGESGGLSRLVVAVVDVGRRLDEEWAVTGSPGNTGEKGPRNMMALGQSSLGPV